MTLSISCPICAHSLELPARFCNHCGADLAIAAAIAEQEVSLAAELPTGLPVTPEILLPRIGDFMLEQNVITPAQLKSALDYQQEKAGEGAPILLGQAIRELGYVDQKILDKMITVQIVQLQNALHQANRELEMRVEERTRDLQLALKKLTELNQLKANFVANVSHELRTPLTLIKGYLDILAEEGFGPLTPEQKYALEALLKAESRLETQIQDLIQFAIAARGQLALKLEPVQIVDVVRSIMPNLQDRAHSAGVSLEVDLAVDLPVVQIDLGKISWVIAQLVDNAIKFNHEGGRVRLEATKENGLVTIAITDNGIGIPSDRLDELFEPFHQLDGSATRKYGGTGLGLALSSRILEAHAAKMRVQSVVGRGSRFDFSLPTDQLQTD